MRLQLWFTQVIMLIWLEWYEIIMTYISWRKTGNVINLTYNSKWVVIHEQMYFCNAQFLPLCSLLIKTCQKSKEKQKSPMDFAVEAYIWESRKEMDKSAI